MAYLTRHVVTLTSDGAGAATGYTGVASGYVHAIRYVAGTPAFDNTVDFTITAESSGLAIITVTNETASATYYPRAATVSTANAAALYASGGVAVNDKIAVAQERIQIVIAQAGAAHVGTFHVYVGG